MTTKAEKWARRKAVREELIRRGNPGLDLKELARDAKVPRVTQQQFLDACPPDEDLGKVFLHYSSTVAVELVDYQVVPVVTEAERNAELGLDLPLVLVRASALSGPDNLVNPIKPMWLRRVEAGLEQPNGKRNLNLYVSSGDRYVAPETRPPAQRAADRVFYQGVDTTCQQHPKDQCGELENYPWVLMQHAAALPALYVPVGSEHLNQRWLELYARLVLGEEIE